MAKEFGFIHIARSEFTPQEHAPECLAAVKGRLPDDDLEVGYGRAGGGFGAYGYCRKCGAIRWKTEDNGE